MTLLDPALGALVLLACCSLVSALTRRRPRLSLAIGHGGVLAASALGMACGLTALIGNSPFIEQRLAWTLPLGELHFALDGLSAFFLAVVSLISGLSALYGLGYQKRAMSHAPLGLSSALLPLLVLAMFGVVLARDGIVFLMAWELMTLSSYFLVVHEGRSSEVRQAGLIYLIASQLGVIAIFVLFALLARQAQGFDFNAWQNAPALSASLAGACFVLAVVGFGTKAGIWPFHIWLPLAHPAAPSHVSALMSGVMIKLGIYGLFRTLGFLGEVQGFWGFLLIALGIISGVVGILQALAQSDLKKLLAFCSMENIGIITLGLGIGLFGQSHKLPAIAFLGYAGALVHVLNHALFKSLLFFAAGGVYCGTGSRDMEIMGGLARRMPQTALLFLIGAAAICGLPPLNGFVGEWLIYLAAFRTGQADLDGAGLAILAVIPVVALIGGLAAACFVKAYGVVFLGEGRSAAVEKAQESGLTMRLAMGLAALLCLLIGLWPTSVLTLIEPILRDRLGANLILPSLGGAFGSLQAAGLALFALFGLLLALRWRLLRDRPQGRTATWGCGYNLPTPRMQYTAGSFAQPLLKPFSVVVPSHTHATSLKSLFPGHAHFVEHTTDIASERLWQPVARALLRSLGQFRRMQQGRVQAYLTYILLTLLGLLVWLILTGGV